MTPTGRAVGEFAGQFPSLIGCFLRLVGSLFCLVCLLLGPFGSAASLLGGGAGLVGPLLGPCDVLLVGPFPGQIGRFLSQIRGVFRRGGRLIRSLGPHARMFGGIARSLRQAASLSGSLLGLGQAGVLVVVARDGVLVGTA